MNRLPSRARTAPTTAILFSALLAGSTLALLPNSANAQQPESGRQPASDPLAGGQWNVQALISLNFPGGTVSEYIETIRRAAGNVPLNVSYNGNAGLVKMPAVSLKSVTIEKAVYAVMALAERSNDGMAGVTQVIAPNAPNTGAPLYAIGMSGAGAQAGKVAVNRVISLNPVISRGSEKTPVETVLTAIETALRNDQTGVDLKFHPDSGLLFVSGSEAQCRLAEEVVDKMIADGAARRRATRKPATEKFALSHIDAASLADTLRVAFPTPASQPSEVTIVPEPNTNSVVVNAPEDLIVAVRAIVRYADTKPETNPALMEMRMNAELAEKKFQAARKEADDMQARVRDQMQEMSKYRMDIEAEKVRVETAAQQMQEAQKKNLDTHEMLRKQLAECDAASRAHIADIERMRARMESLEIQLQAARKELLNRAPANNPK